MQRGLKGRTDTTWFKGCCEHGGAQREGEGSGMEEVWNSFESKGAKPIQKS